MEIIEDLMFWTDFSCMIGSGVPLEKSLQILSELTQEGEWHEFCEHSLEQLKQGNTFGSSCLEYVDLVGPVAAAIIEHTEKEGRLAEGMDRVLIHVEAHVQAMSEEMLEEFFDEMEEEDFDEDDDPIDQN